VPNSCITPLDAIEGHIPINIKGGKKMEDKKGDGIKILLKDVDKELTPHLR